MSTGFFKDITGGNNKFIPRSFQFNLGHNDSAKESPDTSIISKDSSVPYKDASVSSLSTGASSKFFKCNSSAESVEINGGKEVATYLLDELSLESINEDEQKPSTKAVNEIKRAEPIDDNDLEITEIREVSADPNGSNLQEVSTYNAVSEPIEQSSSDVLLEALYKSQRVCTSLKRSLEIANSKISQQEDLITRNKKNFDSMKSNFKNFKTSLYLIEKNAKDLVEVRASDSTKIKELKEDYVALTENIAEYKNEIGILKKKIENLKQLKNATSYEIERRNKDISTLQKRLDETSGFLSEQKIRTLQLEKILETSRESYDAKMEKNRQDTKQFQTELMSRITDSELSIATHIKGLCDDEIRPLMTHTSETMTSKINDLAERLTKALDLSDSSLSAQIERTSKLQLEEATKCTLEASRTLNSGLSTVIGAQKVTGTLLDKISSLFQEAAKTNTSSQTSVNCNLLELIKKLDHLKQAINSSSEDSRKIDILNEKVEVLSKEVFNATNSAKDLEQIINERNKEIEDFKNKTEVLTLKEDELIKKILSLEASLSARDLILKESEDKFHKSKSTVESKLKTQMDIYKMVVKERDDIEAELEASKSNSDRIAQLYMRQVDELKAELQESHKKVEEASKVKCNCEAELVMIKQQKMSLEDKIKEQTKVLAVRPPSVEGEVHYEVLGSPTLSKSVLGRRPTILDEFSTKHDFPPKATQPSKLQGTFKTKAKSRVHLPPQGKRKKLLDEDEDSTFIFDKFDLDSIEEELPTLPKKYTKRKKTKA